MREKIIAEIKRSKKQYDRAKKRYEMHTNKKDNETNNWDFWEIGYAKAEMIKIRSFVDFLEEVLDESRKEETKPEEKPDGDAPADKNYFGLLFDDTIYGAHPAVHLKGHLSLHFDILSEVFLYTSCQNLSKGKFSDTLAYRNIIMIPNEDGSFLFKKGNGTEILITENGNVFINGKLRKK